MQLISTKKAYITHRGQGALIYTMEFTDTLPALALKQFDDCGSRIIYVQQSDLDRARKFGKSWLVLTDSSIASVSGSGIDTQFRLTDVSEVRTDELVGGGRISVVTTTGVHHIISYSNHLVPHFSSAGRFLNDTIGKRSPQMPAAQRSGFCTRCNSPLPDRESACPRCVSRFHVFRRILHLAAPYRLKIVWLMLVTGAGVAFQVIPPYITRQIVDNVIGKGQSDKLVVYSGAMLASGLAYLCMRLLTIHLTSWISARIVGDLRSRIHAALQYLQLSFFNRREPGEIVGRIMHDTGELLQFLVEGMPFLLINTLSFVVVAVILVKINWSLSLFVFMPAPLLILGSGWFWRKLHPLFLRQGSMLAHLHSVLNESIHGLRVIKALSQEKRRITQFDAVNGKLAATQMTTRRIFGSFNEVMFWIMSLGVTLVWFCGVRMITGADPAITLGDLLAFVGYIWLFYGPLQWYSVILDWMTHAFAGAERIFEVIDSAPEIHNRADSTKMPAIKGTVEFREVRFSYERGKEVIRGVSFKIARGEIVGLVGRSGAGKSTIINLLTRFFEPDAGQILIDGIPLSQIDLRQLRSNMGIVMQEPFLFNATIAENIAYGLDSASFSDITEAARAAYAHEFIVRKPDGYDSVVGDSGLRLSGGEKQRIAIARAILLNPPILILDEATSSVDAATEAHIQESINRLIAGRTTIAIAHRLSTLRNANRLIVLDNGHVAETGTHEELVSGGGIYAELAWSHSHLHSLHQTVPEGV